MLTREYSVRARGKRLKSYDVMMVTRGGMQGCFLEMDADLVVATCDSEGMAYLIAKLLRDNEAATRAAAKVEG